MTPQAELRNERIAIMITEGATEAEAIAFCDSQPWLYGTGAQAATQTDMGFRTGRTW